MDRALYDTCVKALGLAFGHRQQNHIDDQQRAPSLMLHLCTRRLRYAPRLLTKAPKRYYTHSFTTHPPPQWNAGRLDPRTLRDTSDTKLHELPPTTTDDPTPEAIQTWLDFAARHPLPWARLIAHAATYVHL